jgi:hypothetical protein
MGTGNYKSSFLQADNFLEKRLWIVPALVRLHRDDCGSGGGEHCRAVSALRRASGFTAQCGWLTASCSRICPKDNVWSVGADGADLLIWEPSSRFLCTAIITSSHMERLPTRALRSRAKPSWRSALAPRRLPPRYLRWLRWRPAGTKSSLTLPLRNTCPTATRSARSGNYAGAGGFHFGNAR